MFPPGRRPLRTLCTLRDLAVTLCDVRIALFVIAAWLTLATLAVIHRLGKPPGKPTTGGQAAFLVLINAAIVTTLVLAAGRVR